LFTQKSEDNIFRKYFKGLISVRLSIRPAYSCIFHPCDLLPIFPLLHFPPLHFWPYCIFHSLIFSRPIHSSTRLSALGPA